VAQSDWQLSQVLLVNGPSSMALAGRAAVGSHNAPAWTENLEEGVMANGTAAPSSFTH
jgi:hypothetical protein